MQLLYLFSPLQVLYISQRVPLLLCRTGPAGTTNAAACFDTERMIVTFSSKGVNHISYLAHVITVAWCVCYRLCNSYAIVFRRNRHINYRPQFQDRQRPHILISRRAVRRRRHYRQIIESQQTARSVVGVEPTTFRTAATDDDKDWRLYRNSHRGQSLIICLSFF